MADDVSCIVLGKIKREIEAQVPKSIIGERLAISLQDDSENKNLFSICFMDKGTNDNSRFEKLEYGIFEIKKNQLEEICTRLERNYIPIIIGQYRKIPSKREKKYSGPIRLSKEKNEKGTNMIFKVKEGNEWVEEYKLENLNNEQVEEMINYFKFFNLYHSKK